MPSLYDPTFGEIKIDIEEKQTSITTSRLTMKSINQGDLILDLFNYCILLGKKENTKMFRNGETWTFEEVLDFFIKHTKLWDQGEHFSIFAVYKKNTDEFLGTLNLYFKDKEYEYYSNAERSYTNVAEIGYVVDIDYCGHKFGTEFATVAIKYIEYLTLELSKSKTPTHPIPTRIVATVHPGDKEKDKDDPGNIASMKILEKLLGGREEKITKKFNGQPRALYYGPPLKTAADAPPHKLITPPYNKDRKRRLPTLSMWTIVINPETPSDEKEAYLERMRALKVDADSLPTKFIPS